ncbi:MAG: hypothetical protein GXP08_12645 [Gammaproteobacteria bacterium]|nr:hypothetical protein [Gammaproteobacteria bacterium]
MPSSSPVSIPNNLPPPEQYTGMDDVLIPAPSYPYSILSEQYVFRVVGKDENGALELATQVYIASDLFEQTTTTQTQAAGWIAAHSGNKTRRDIVSRSDLTGPEALVPAIANDNGEVISAPYTFTIETQGANHLMSEKLMDDHDDDYRYRQVFRLYPLSAQQIFTVRVVREIQYYNSHPMFAPQYAHFLASLRPEVATPQSSLAGSQALTRRFYSAYFSFEIPTPAEYKGNNQWAPGFLAQRSDDWHLPEGDIAVNIWVKSHHSIDPKRKNAKIRSDMKGLVGNLPGFLKSMDPDESVAEMTYLEVPFGEQLFYGRLKIDESAADMEFQTAYKKGKSLEISFSSSTAIIKQYQQAIFAWLSQIQILK